MPKAMSIFYINDLFNLIETKFLSNWSDAKRDSLKEVAEKRLVGRLIGYQLPHEIKHSAFFCSGEE